MKQDTDAATQSRRLSTALAACIGMCLASKESVRFTAVWYFDIKSVSALFIIFAFCAIMVAVMMATLHAGKFTRRQCAACTLLLTMLQTAGLIVHALEHGGATIPKWMSLLAWLGKDGSVVTLALYAAHLCLLKKGDAIRCLGSAITLAGSLQILLCFINAGIARMVICILPAMSFVTYATGISRIEKPALEKPYLNVTRTEGGLPSRHDADVADARRDLLGACGWVFLLSTLLMCAYSNWHTQQDGDVISLLIQLTSGAGLLMGGVIVLATRRLLEDTGSFLACRDVAFPVALAAVYLSTLFSGSGISLPVLLFDIAYAFILVIVLLRPFFGTRGLSFLTWISAGLLAYKAGWFLGVLTTTTLQIPWLGTVVATVSLVLLVILMALHLAARGRRRTAEQPNPTPLDYFALACDHVCTAYGLTSREVEVFALLARGRTSGYIQKALPISDGTARTHITHIYRKLEVNSQQMLLDVLERTIQQLEREATGAGMQTD